MKTAFEMAEAGQELISMAKDANGREQLNQFILNNTGISMEILEDFVAGMTRADALMGNNDPMADKYMMGCIMFDLGVFFAIKHLDNVEWKGGPTDKEVEEREQA